MSSISPEMQEIKEKMKATWATGDFGVIAKIIEDEGRNFINRLNIKPGDKVLDIACGNGNLSIPAAKLGAVVTGIDIVPDLIRQARQKSKTEGLNIQFDEGDAEAMPYKDNEFDTVVSMFGIMFAPRPDAAASEMLRVCKPGGRIAMANWTPEGFTGKMFKLSASHVPPPHGVPPPVLWGNEETAKQRLGDRVSNLKLKRVMLRENIPMSPPDVVEHFRQYFGPTQRTFMALDEEGQKKLRQDTIELWEKYNIAKDGTTMVDAEYLEVIATKIS
ncbi:MAG: class I SAM-dependent methyltransferase [Ignavibacteria bacterium]